MGTIETITKTGKFKKEPVRVVTIRTRFSNGQVEDEYWTFYQKPPQKLVYVTKETRPEKTFLRINADGTGFIQSENEKTYFYGKPINLTFQQIHGLDDWLRSFPKPGSTFYQQGINFDTRTITSLQYCISPGKHVGVRSVILKGDKIVGFSKTNENGTLISQRMFGVDFIRKATPLCQTRLKGQRIPSAICIGFDRPLSRPDRLKKLIFEIPGDVKIPPSQFMHLNYQNGITRITITAPEPVENKNVMISHHLKSDRTYPLQDKRLIQFVEKTVPLSVQTPKEKINLVFQAVSTQIKTTSRQRSVSEGLKQKNGDCVTKAEIFASACRKLQIPSRVVYGLVVQSDPQIGFVPHAWNEVQLEGKWINLDTTRPTQQVDARYLYLGIDSPPTTANLIIWGNWPAMLIQEEYTVAIYKEGK